MIMIVISVKHISNTLILDAIRLKNYFIQEFNQSRLEYGVGIYIILIIDLKIYIIIYIIYILLLHGFTNKKRETKISQ